jgi:hypothetical protein
MREGAGQCLFRGAQYVVEPTTGLEPMTCRLRIMGKDATRRNPKHQPLPSHPKAHPMCPHSSVSGRRSGHRISTRLLLSARLLRGHPSSTVTFDSWTQRLRLLSAAHILSTHLFVTGKLFTTVSQHGSASVEVPFLGPQRNADHEFHCNQLDRIRVCVWRAN